MRPDITEVTSDLAGMQDKLRERLGYFEDLLDPLLTLADAAFLLDVCPTTVRRYTNRGVLRCLRTPGSQRRFKLSHILEFREKCEVALTEPAETN